MPTLLHFGKRRLLGFILTMCRVFTILEGLGEFTIPCCHCSRTTLGKSSGVDLDVAMGHKLTVLSRTTYWKQSLLYVEC